MLDSGRIATRLGKWLLPNCLWQLDPNRRAIALTFDDGPHPEHTPRVLDLLDQHQSHATFFWLGDKLAIAPDVVRRIATGPHAIGLHGHTHQSFLMRRPAAIVEAFVSLREQIALLTGRDQAAFKNVRPPWGLATPAHVSALRAAGFQVVMAGILPGDWAAPPETVCKRVLAQVRNGSLIALHDGPTGRNAHHILRSLLPSLLDQGYELTTLSRQGR
jgi:peptidoglycan/xylan/chitin deacetylase (PgdA/CDA1 family)